MASHRTHLRGNEVDFTLPCGCHHWWSGKFEFCRLHSAAGDLLKALEDAANRLELLTESKAPESIRSLITGLRVRRPSSMSGDMEKLLEEQMDNIEKEPWTRPLISEVQSNWTDCGWGDCPHVEIPCVGWRLP